MGRGEVQCGVNPYPVLPCECFPAPPPASTPPQSLTEKLFFPGLRGENPEGRRVKLPVGVTSLGSIRIWM